MKKPVTGVVYSTNPEFQYQYNQPEEIQTLPPAQQRLKVALDSKARAGKQVTIISGFIGQEQDLETLSKLLKNLCGAGGAAKEGQILIQGNFMDKVKNYLRDKEYRIV
jgi:translation initiation factor 1